MCQRLYFNKIVGRKHKKSLWHRCFLVNFGQFLRTPVLYRIPPVAASDEIVGKFCKKELKKTNQREFRIKEVLKINRDKLYMNWKSYDNPFNSSIMRVTKWPFSF